MPTVKIYNTSRTDHRRRTVTEHKTGTREERLAARLKLLEAEKELTRRSDELARRRQQLPWVRMDEKYAFDTDQGERPLRDRFAGALAASRLPLHVRRTWTQGCATCTLHAERFDRAIIHLNQRDVTMVCIWRAPLSQLNGYKRRMGFTFRWVSSQRSDFNYDFGVSLPPGADPDKVPFNFATTRFYNREEREGLSAFALEDGVVYQTYSCHLRGVEEFNITYQLLDRAPRGRDEDNLRYRRAWIHRRDEYGAAAV